jgi:hypothetical protein
VVPCVSLVLGFGLVPSVADGASAVSQQLAGPDYHRPAVGLCYDLTTRQANKPSSTKAAVPCDAPHTMMTVKVVRLPDGVTWKNVTTRAFFVACEKAMVATLGGSIKQAAMSAYDWWYFGPTKEERARGARWIRCDLGIHKGAGGVGKLPVSVALGTSLSTRETRCLTGRNLVATSCQQSHKFRAKGVFKLDRLARTQAQYEKQGSRCPKITSSRRYAYDGPSELEWKAGDHWMVCFKPD